MYRFLSSSSTAITTTLPGYPRLFSFNVPSSHPRGVQDGQLSAIDILSAAGLVNYFGRADDPNDVSIYPLLFQKGETKVCRTASIVDQAYSH